MMKSKVFGILGAMLLCIVGFGAIVSPVSAGAMNTTLSFSGNLMQQVNISTTGTDVPFSLNLGMNTFNNRSIVYSTNVPIKIVASDTSAGKNISKRGFLTEWVMGTYGNTSLGSPMNISLSTYGSSLVVSPADLTPTLALGVGVSLPVQVQQFVDWSDPVVLGGRVYRADINFLATVV
jgi:hypothetical protein